jgi:hypothetical protein
MPSVAIKSIMLSVVIMNVIMLSVDELSVIMLSGFILSVDIISVVMLSVVMLRVAAPYLRHEIISCCGDVTFAICSLLNEHDSLFCHCRVFAYRVTRLGHFSPLRLLL